MFLPQCLGAPQYSTSGINCVHLVLQANLDSSAKLNLKAIEVNAYLNDILSIVFCAGVLCECDKYMSCSCRALFVEPAAVSTLFMSLLMFCPANVTD